MNPLADVADAAAAIRPYLAELLSAPAAQTLGHQLEPLPPADVARQLLEAHETTREWLRLYQAGMAAAEILPHMRRYQPLVGGTPIESPRYVCPVASCLQDWYRPAVGAEIPRCPIHDVVLVRYTPVEAP